ncbi:MAG: tRNA (adenosine(37)-N6)-dimethylallyltransferase MiaA [Microcoleus sp. PH2017_29_MFU_D_A]|jgi:tRNA dimethylallyltransferase|uniref:tRNA (adenosine(37)-N6)-dimethylallyltransferase MiaA n=1 Tax=unclassified Microcoleus TaxID=2642155 RepID=UPI001DE4F9D3|nr:MULTISPECIES: tRNA (adenosine(37)-N6)-dimethylallyltransferase MiaA [unclassified Microcoleus]MCC3417790.1 tRNA (adenosine(37)-N6)-dimethylallyltransferase MiaA [Microcoleus sp. PH2017_07_MST_O_A]MCC3510742.1 tRNA (adenosine(37)-N6)-dimethylallyltransferase MiaA [Microcoleus sp. PH2017_17_BER_D_A]TAE56732.1 MAG: tRNA (adenosine(37)-N6)-dimethylallyltransferase MiaA [Oscillatoriales cyanobacterium]MCC3424823.1 tRNA (adenosine(37)-N6)-dimethylallyltransferase MiaA [Microcoleus sp. PH2017_01_SC
MFRLITICGATATGKSGVAVEVADRLKSSILSADSRQVYREFDIGTAKPTKSDRASVPHHLIDICEPTETLTLAEYQQQAQKIIADVDFPVSPPLLLVGGTGLYIKSIVKGLKMPRVAPMPELRSQLADLGQSQCYAMLQQVDRPAAEKIHLNDSFRTLRALEVFYVTGRSISEQQGENPPNYPILQIGLDCEMDVLGDRIQQRTEQMLERGWLAEVEYLCKKYGCDLPLLNTLGYQEIKRYLAGDITLEEAKELTILHTRQFAKRQRTWFRAYPEIEWFDVSVPDLLERVWQRIQNFLVKGS